MAPGCARQALPGMVPPLSCAPVRRRVILTPGRDGWNGPKGLLHRRRGPEQVGHPDPHVPRRARHCHQLRQCGGDLAPYLPQRAAHGP